MLFCSVFLIYSFLHFHSLCVRASKKNLSGNDAAKIKDDNPVDLGAYK